jgi:GNAT superfamily N-acetyltransferase
MGANNADFHGVGFSHEESPYGELTIRAHHSEHGQIGKLYASEPREGHRYVASVFVHPDHRRKGVATGMWNYAKQNGFSLKHSQTRTEDGDSWAKSVGD